MNHKVVVHGPTYLLWPHRPRIPLVCTLPIKEAYNINEQYTFKTGQKYFQTQINYPFFSGVPDPSDHRHSSSLPHHRVNPAGAIMPPQSDGGVQPLNGKY